MVMLVAGIDSSTQSCKVVVCDRESGRTVREGRADHPAGTVVNPEAWWNALLAAVADAGGLGDVSAVSVSAQQHTPVFLGADGGAVCDSPLWNDVDSHPQVAALNQELGYREWIRRTGLPLTLSDTVVKLRWLSDTDPDAADRTVAVALVHDWLTWRLRGFGPANPAIDQLTTDRSDASGTGYWSGVTEDYRPDLVRLAFGRAVTLPTVLGPLDSPGVTGDAIPGIPAGIPVGVGSGDNAAASLSLGLEFGDAVMSLGTSGVVYCRSVKPVADYSGVVCSYAGARGDHLPLAATLNAARSLDAAATLLGCTHQELSDLALSAPPGAEGLTMLPYFEGERTPDLPHARASLQGASLGNFTRPNLARAAIEGMLASQLGLLNAVTALGITVKRLILIGGAAQSPAVRQILAQLCPLPVLISAPEEHVARGAAMQAAATLTGTFPQWPVHLETVPAESLEPTVLEQHERAKAALGY